MSENFTSAEMWFDWCS